MTTLNLTDVLQQQDPGLTAITEFGGDISGTSANISVDSLQGLDLPTSGFADGLGLRISSGQWVLATFLTEASSFSGDVTGSQLTGIVVRAIDGNVVEASSPEEGDSLVYSSGAWVNRRGSYQVLTGNTTVSLGRSYAIDTTAGSFTITAFSNSQPGDFFRVRDIGGNVSAAAVSIVFPNGETVQGFNDISFTANYSTFDFMRGPTEWRVYAV